MKNALVLAVELILLIRPAFAAGGEASTSAGYLDAGVGIVDITPPSPSCWQGRPPS
jgi:hypothetical protein